MAATNNVTGDSLVSKPTSQEYLDNYDRIFGKKIKEQKLNSEDLPEYQLNKSTGEVEKVPNE